MAITKINTPELFDLGTTNSSLRLPSGDTASRPTNPNTGEWRYNTDDNYVEYWDGSEWFQIDYETAAPTCTTNTINYPTAVTAYYKMEDATDQTGSYDGTPINVNFNVAGKFGNAGEFNGSSSSISLPTSIKPADSIMSISLWASNNSTARKSIFFLEYNNAPAFLALENNLYTDSTALGVYYNNAIAITAPNETLPTDGSWHHLVVTASATEVKLYKNGSQIGSTASITVNTNALTEAHIGVRHYNNDLYWDGKIDQVRIFPSVLTAAQVTQLYNEVQCAPTIVPTNNFNVNTYVGTGATQVIDAKFNEAANFNGSNSSKIDLPSNFNLANNSFTISAWWGNTKSSGNSYGITSSGSGTSCHTNLHIGRRGSNGKFSFAFFCTDLDSSTSISTDGTWQHWVCTYDASTNSRKIYLNGIEDASDTASNDYIGTANLQLGGGTNWGTGNEYRGSLDQVRIFNTALTGPQVTDLYNNETDATAQLLNFPVGAGCIAAYKLDGNADDISGLYSGTPTDVGYTGMEFAPDLVWIKSRGSVRNHMLATSVQQQYNYISSNLINAEATSSARITSLDSNGFTIGSSANVNSNNVDYVAWNWKAGGAAVAAGGTNLTNRLVSANPEAGFSIMTYTGSSSDGTIEHGLNAKPELWIFKNLSVPKSWFTLTNIIDGSVDYGFLNTTDLFGNAGQADATDTVLNVNLDGGSGLLNASGNNYVAYAFHSVDGMSKIGSYVGTGATGNTIVTGFEPAFLMTKRTDTGGTDWHIWDNKRNPSNPVDDVLFPNEAYAEADYSAYPHNFLSNGFSVDTTNGAFNASGGTYIFLAIAADPAPEPVLANSFNTVTYTGTGTTGGNTLPVTGFGFQPDLVWVKNRDVAVNHYLYDSVRGTGTAKALHSNTTSSESTASIYAVNGGVSSFLSDGFTAYRGTDNTYQGTNMNGQDYVAWAWKASNESTINQDGGITSIVSANPAAGFSIVSYTGNGTNNSSVGHGLNQAPEMFIYKRTSSTSDWLIVHKDVNNYQAYLKFTSATFTNDTNMNAPTDSVIRFNTTSPTFNGSSQDWLIYAFHSVDGYQKVGSYSGNSTSGRLIQTDFAVRWVMIRATNAPSNWFILDSERGGTNDLRANSSNAEEARANGVTFVSNGFELDDTSVGFNNTGKNYIYLAIA